jgi:hypothetical protein
MVFDPALYERQRRNLQQQFAGQSALNAYQKYLQQTQAQRGIQQIEESPFGIRREVPRLTSAYGQRGLTGQGVRSGIYNRALGEYGQQQTRRLGFAQQDLADMLRGYDLRQSQFQSGYETGLADLESDKARQIAADAAALINLR